MFKFFSVVWIALLLICSACTAVTFMLAFPICLILPQKVLIAFSVWSSLLVGPYIFLRWFKWE